MPQGKCPSWRATSIDGPSKNVPRETAPEDGTTPLYDKDVGETQRCSGGLGRHPEQRLSVDEKVACPKTVGRSEGRELT